MPARHTNNNPLTSSEAGASHPGGGGGGGGLDTSDQKCSCSCSGAFGPLCSPWRPPRAGGGRGSTGRWSSCCGDAPPLTHCHASWSFYTWIAYSETIFSPKKRENAHKCHCGEESALIKTRLYRKWPFIRVFTTQWNAFGPQVNIGRAYSETTLSPKKKMRIIVTAVKLLLNNLHCLDCVSCGLAYQSTLT